MLSTFSVVPALILGFYILFYVHIFLMYTHGLILLCQPLFVSLCWILKKWIHSLCRYCPDWGHMSYDVVGAQILQTGIPESKANLIGTTEVSIASLAESVILGVAIVANDVSHFGSLAMLSLLSVVAAALLFCRWLGNPTDAQRSLFNFDSQFWLHMCKCYVLHFLLLIMLETWVFCLTQVLLFIPKWVKTVGEPDFYRH